MAYARKTYKKRAAPRKSYAKKRAPARKSYAKKRVAAKPHTIRIEIVQSGPPAAVNLAGAGSAQPIRRARF